MKCMKFSTCEEYQNPMKISLCIFRLWQKNESIESKYKNQDGESSVLV